MMTPQQRRAVRVVVGLLVAGLALGMAFAALTLIFRGNVLAYQQNRHPHADPAALARTLWTRPIPILIVAGLYVWVARQLLAGAHRAYRRVRIVSILGFVAVGWLFVSAEYPAWLRVVQGVQLAVLAALIAAVNRPVVRAAFPPVPGPRLRNRRAALLLAVLAPVVAEVTLGTVPLRLAWAWLLFAPVYSAGALFVREVVRRTDGGYPNLLLMGVAYGLLEEGLALQSLTSPHLYHAADWAPRLFGVNTAYAELNLVYHAVFSIAVPIALTELCFARHGTTPYLRRGGVIAAGIVALLGSALLRGAVPPSEDPGYNMPLPAVLGVAAAIAVLAALALRVRVRPARPAVPPRPAVLGALTAVTALVFLGAIWPFAGARQPLFTHGAWALLPMGGAAAVAAATLVALRRWTAADGWTSPHTLAACTGALAGHTVFGLIGNADSLLDRAYLTAVTVLTVVAGVVAAKRIHAPVAPSASANRSGIAAR
ncbi:hypothetical protein B0E53_00294 [Micromonospora sp. MH33]|uniref:hypothetical protein n=1 Tax=Micromonospora sp. MH33 TaxID=1945509 RepID=UPI000D14A1CA|nr:hypothetical protein [Micromonospora sp. MH33]PSK67823.1 hypothetical protein B0E53_00294 [Micromonospora sp. MH33]